MKIYNESIIFLFEEILASKSMFLSLVRIRGDFVSGEATLEKKMEKMKETKALTYT